MSNHYFPKLHPTGCAQSRPLKFVCIPQGACEIHFVNIVLKIMPGTSLTVQQLRLCAPNAGGLGSIPAQGTRSHVPVVTKSPHATTKIPGMLQLKTWHSQTNKQTNKYFLKINKIMLQELGREHIRTYLALSHLNTICVVYNVHTLYVQNFVYIIC